MWLCICLNNAGKWACDRLTKDEFGQKKIIFSDEVHIDLDGYVNKENLHAYIEKPRHSKRVLRQKIFM